ncbi:MAG TPA: hypothetical protein VHA11_09260 [Bryobacteraceae bacterium]|nr:hypothetical protein [Bryobacteraceae bacterium]
MGLPESIRVKISSEEAEFIALTPVVVRQMPLRELIELLLGSTGKEPPRLVALLRTGSYVSGASRFRWEGFAATPEEVEALLATFPDHDPARPFAESHCVRAVLRGPDTAIEMTRAAASERRMFRKHTFWDILMQFAEAAAPRYVAYSYRERADHYEAVLDTAAAAALRESAGTLRYSTLEAQVRRARLDRIELFVERSS